MTWKVRQLLLRLEVWWRKSQAESAEYNYSQMSAYAAGSSNRHAHDLAWEDKQKMIAVQNRYRQAQEKLRLFDDIHKI